LLVPAAANAEDAKKEPEKTSRWYDKLSISGDFRLRYEGFNWEGHFDEGRRHRFRYRLRFGFRAQLFDSLALGVGLRSGRADNPISDNQSFDDSFSKGQISLAEAWLDWRATETFSAIGGKFPPTKLWTSADMEWDDDVTTEGAMEMFAWKPGGVLKGLDLNFYQFVLNESSDTVDAYMLGGQVVPVFDLGETNDLAVGVTFEAVSNPEVVGALYLTRKVYTDADYVTNFWDPLAGKFASDFRVGSLSFEWKNTSVKGWPATVTVFLYKNFGAGEGSGVILPIASDRDSLAVGRGIDNDTAWFGRIQVGDYKKPGQVALRFSRYDSKPDALFFAYSQSDSRRSSNVNGYRADLRIGMPRQDYINVTWYNTRWTRGSDSTMNRWQFDYIFRF
ncbi:MAG: putative porin, partial [Acidobacteriota bacterium]